MGFRSTFVTSHCDITWPVWFREKYARSIHFSSLNNGVIASITEGKFYTPGVGIFATLVDDIAKVDNVRGNDMFYLAVLHENGLVDLYEFPASGEIQKHRQADEPPP